MGTTKTDGLRLWIYAQEIAQQLEEYASMMRDLEIDLAEQIAVNGDLCDEINELRGAAKAVCEYDGGIDRESSDYSEAHQRLCNILKKQGF